MRVTCSSCSATVPTEDINITRLVAKCRACGAVFSFESQIPARPSNLAPVVAPAPEPELPLPPGITLVHEGTEAASDYRTTEKRGTLRITRRWFEAQHIFMLFFCIAWDSFLVFWYATAFASNGPWLMFVFPLLHLAAGIGITYGTLCGLFNRTTITIDGAHVTVRHGPIPARGNRAIPIEQVRQLYTEENVGSKGTKSYELKCVVAVGPTLKLVDGVNAQQALYIERAVETHLDIVNARIAGDYVG